MDVSRRAGRLGCVGAATWGCAGVCNRAYPWVLEQRGHCSLPRQRGAKCRGWLPAASRPQHWLRRRGSWQGVEFALEQEEWLSAPVLVLAVHGCEGCGRCARHARSTLPERNLLCRLPQALGTPGDEGVRGACRRSRRRGGGATAQRQAREKKRRAQKEGKTWRQRERKSPEKDLRQGKLEASQATRQESCRNGWQPYGKSW